MDTIDCCGRVIEACFKIMCSLSRTSGFATDIEEFVNRSECPEHLQSATPTVEVLLNLFGIMLNDILVRARRPPINDALYQAPPVFLSAFAAMPRSYEAFLLSMSLPGLSNMYYEVGTTLGVASGSPIIPTGDFSKVTERLGRNALRVLASLPEDHVGFELYTFPSRMGVCVVRRVRAALRHSGQGVSVVYTPEINGNVQYVMNDVSYQVTAGVPFTFIGGSLRLVPGKVFTGAVDIHVAVRGVYNGSSDANTALLVDPGCGFSELSALGAPNDFPGVLSTMVRSFLEHLEVPTLADCAAVLHPLHLFTLGRTLYYMIAIIDESSSIVPSASGS